MRIARVFPKKTSFTPIDEHAYYDIPDMFTPDYDEVHVSVVFTWDMERAQWLAKQWEHKGRVIIGGPACGDPGGEFTPGLYVKHGITITTRGCNNRCGFCFVPKREGKLRELVIKPGYVVQDNNLLQASPEHIDRVFKMLETQKGIRFVGGLESRLITPEVVERFKALNISELWLAYDKTGNYNSVKKAVELLKPYFNQRQIRVYVLIGTADDTVEEARRRLDQILHMGALPFAQRFRQDSKDFKNSFLHTERPWKLLAREFSRPAIMMSKLYGTGNKFHKIMEEIIKSEMLQFK